VPRAREEPHWCSCGRSFCSGRALDAHAAALSSVQETPSTSLQYDFVRVDASEFCVQISRTRAEMINGPRRSRIGPKLTEIRASKVEKTRKTPGFPGHRSRRRRTTRSPSPLRCRSRSTTSAPRPLVADAGRRRAPRARRRRGARAARPPSRPTRTGSPAGRREREAFRNTKKK
jgi:hypothetical protein